MLKRNFGEPTAPQPDIKVAAKPEFNLNDWVEQMHQEVKDKLEHQERVVVNLAGASASGKGEASKKLQESLEADGITTAVFSTDNFYKGISRMVTQKIPEHLSLEEVKEVDLKGLSDYIRSITRDLDFGDKFNSENLEKIRSYVTERYPDLADQLMEAIIFEKDHPDFDNPQVVDLPLVAEDIKILKEGGKVEIPKYDMKISEQNGGTEVDGSKVQAIIIEGLYGLDETVLGDSDIRSYIEAEIKTLLMRRMRRDVLGGRSSFSPEMNLWITIKIVMPAFWKFIEPTRANADSVLVNTFTEAETFDTPDYDVQDKIELGAEDLAKIEALCGAPEKSVKQEDYYFTNEVVGHEPEQLIRIRVEDGKLKNLVHKGTKVTRDDGKIVRPTEEYIKDGEFTGEFYKDEEKVTAEQQLAEDFRGAGFSLVEKISKERSVYSYDGIELMVDRIDGLGLFLELRANNKLDDKEKIDEIKFKLGLAKYPSAGPYIDMLLAKNKENQE